ncbi:MAG TPA: hypothetical protein VIW95_05680 [Candidatus Binatus sp.]|uniref:hypothetical protein n=1 Tax=Candidatus Binatus sp. TaxID=2811406 RepID=UPI002F426E5A
MPKHTKLMIVPRLRPGEGREIEVLRRTVPGADGSSTLELQIDISHAPVPDRRYLADAAAVLFESDTLRIVLGQKGLVGSKIRSAVILFLSPHAAIQFLKSCEQFLPEIRKYADEHKIHEALVEIQDEPAHITSVAANIILAAFSGREGCLDLYNSSPFVMGIVQKGGKMALDPILRVDLTTGLLVAVLDKLEELKEHLPPS